MTHEIKKLKIGQKGEFHKTITEYDVEAFAGLTGDYSRIHIDKDYAEEYRFGKQIAHGLIAASFPSTVMGMTMPGPGCLFLDQYCEFKNPTFFGDTIHCEVEFVSYVEKTNVYIGEFVGKCYNQRGELVVDGRYHEMLPKDYFIIEE